MEKKIWEYKGLIQIKYKKNICQVEEINTLYDICFLHIFLMLII